MTHPSLGSEVPRPPLRVGLLLDGASAPAWVKHVLEQIQSGDAARIVVAVVNQERISGLTWRRLGRFASSLLFRAYEAVDGRVFRSEPDAFAQSSLDELLAQVQVVGATPQRSGFVHRFDERTIHLLAGADLDVVIRFGFNIIKGEILNVARFGVWSYHHGDSRYFRGGPPFFWEMFERRETTGVILQILNDSLDGGRIIYRSLSSTDLTSLSRGRNAAYWKGVHFVVRCLRDLHEDRAGFERRREHLQSSESYDRGIYRTPNNRTMLIFLGKLGTHLLKRLVIRALWRDEWALGFHPTGAEEPLEEREKKFTVSLPPSDRFFADPFLVHGENEHTVFFEEFPYRTGRGFISTAQVDPTGRMDARQPALITDHHLSYPCVFQDGGEIFLVPEAYEGCEIAIYRAESFPSEWQRTATVASGVRAVDPTLLLWEETYWLFCNIALAGMSPNDELHLFHAPSITGPWLPHKRNPIVSDVTRARPAGSVLVSGARLVRPAQDCSGSYGRSIRFFEIDRLDKGGYEEHEIGRLQPADASDVSGIHTYNRIAGLEVTDVRRRRRRVAPSSESAPAVTLLSEID